MTISWLTSFSDHQDQVFYREKEGKEWLSGKGVHRPIIDGLPYLVHRVELSNLTPSKEYLFRIGYGDKEELFRTLPNRLEKDLHFVVGGDVYQSSLSQMQKMDQVVASLDPAFVVIGGDLAYAEDNSSRFSWLFSTDKKGRWIEFLKALSEDLVTKEGRKIPFIALVGNHDVRDGFSDHPQNGALYSVFFPFPGEQGYQALDFGNYLSLICLDSGHMHPIQGRQTKWLQETLEAKKEIPYRFAIYHVPAFPSVRPFNDRHCLAVRSNWTPLFEKYGLTAAFEHHDHAYKRTRSLHGVLYLGDGGWGVLKPRIPATPRKRPYLATSFSKRHVIHVTLKKSSCHFEAVDEEGRVFDATSK